MRIRYILILMMMNVLLHAQSLVLVSGNKEKTIKRGEWIEVSLSRKGDGIESRCNCPSWLGVLKEQANDSVYIHAQRIAKPEIGLESTLSYYSFENDVSKLPVIAIAVKDITLIIFRGGGKEPREYSTLGNIGMLLSIAGSGSLLSSPLAENTGDIALLGVGELITGIILVGIGKRPHYVLSADHPKSRDEKRIWRVQ
jgi:hypothetical protein